MLNLISDVEKKVLFEVQDMPLVTDPFRIISDKLGMSEEKILDICAGLLEKGIIRRIAPSIAHRKVGFSANAMTAASVLDDRMDEVGMAVAQEDGVTHCYSRDGWDHNLFFMVHGQTREEAVSKVSEIAKRHELQNYDIFFSHTELKKTSFRLRKEDLIDSEEAGL